MDRRILQNAVRNILDGELLNRYLYLSTMERSELAKKIGTTPDIVSGEGAEGAGPFLQGKVQAPPTPAGPGWWSSQGRRVQWLMLHPLTLRLMALSESQQESSSA